MDAAPADYYDGLNLKLLRAIPADATRILELGCANGRLGARFKSVMPQAVWHGVDASATAVAQAAEHLDLAVRIDLETDELSRLEGGYDTVVIGDLLEHLSDPGRILEALYDLTTPDARIVACVPNMSHASVVERLIAGDIVYDANGLLDRTHLRFFSPSSLYKLLLDCGWLPNLVDRYDVPSHRSPFFAALIQAAGTLGIPAATAASTFSLYQMIVNARKWSMTSVLRPGPRARFGVIVPVNRPWQHALNVERSPGLAEVGAQVLAVQGATSAADAWARGAPQIDANWILIAHQDVYFPRGTGFALAAELAALEAAGRTAGPVGFAGLVRDTSMPGAVRYRGLVVDRLHLFDHGASGGAVSIDELAVGLHRHAGLRIEPSLGWHLWGTDLCLQAQQRIGRPVAELLDVPLFHNSANDATLPAAFYASAQQLLARYPDLTEVPTLCGAIRRPQPAVA
jgi:2-polyprenyl-3-methyl-5-hydroxy-6-metoxy-1,4-benzoquinol methylase